MAYSVRRNLAWMSIAQGGLLITQFAGSVVLARLLTPHEMGIAAIAYALVAVLSILRANGLSALLIRDPDLTPEVTATAFTVNILVSVITSAAIIGLSGLASTSLGNPGVRRVLTILAVIPILGILEFLPAAQLERAGNFRPIAMVNLLKSAVTTAVTIILALSGFSYMSIAWGSVSNALVSIVCLNMIGWRFVSLRPGLRQLRRVLRFAMQMLSITVIGNVASRMSELLLGRLIGLDALGLYSRASGLNDLLWSNVHLVIGRIVFVDLADRFRQGLPIQDVYLKIVAIITGLLWPAFAGMAVLAAPIIYRIYGPNWGGAGIPFALLSLASLVLSSATMAGEVYMTSNRMDRLLRFEVKRAATSLVLFTLGCLNGLNWAAGARVAEAVATVAYCRSDLQAISGTNIGDYLKIYAQAALLTVLACAPATLLMTAYGWAAEAPLLPLFFGIAGGVVLWLIGLRVLNHPLLHEIDQLVRHLLGARSGQ